MTQVNNYYKANRIELDLDKIVDAAPKRSVSPAESESHKAADSSVPVAASTPDSVERTPPMASLTPDDLPASSGPTPQSNSTRDHTNNATHPTVPSVHEMYAVYPDAHRFPRYTTSVTSPYGAMPMSPIYTGMIGGIPPGTPYTGLASPAGYRPSAGTPPLGAVPPAAAMNGYPPNAYGGGSHYVPYTYPYQQGPSYPPPPYVPPRPASSASPVPSNNAVNPYAHSIPDPTMRSYYPYS
ncbi:hypothetical protein K435DRAFT_190332 [Dendrothele bispora CBS 962.96]|uniref:Uncharacterized protein n=1 Tax=Dendrothele bispora (strain CBS 962.96) TaxID=1314807 RepID=A0A4S8LVP5_DENBC|nr:hypothetical protein K435DRAFT_190332 [Dendrothele bispora CBS 962.96]